MKKVFRFASLIWFLMKVGWLARNTKLVAPEKRKLSYRKKAPCHNEIFIIHFNIHTPSKIFFNVRPGKVVGKAKFVFTLVICKSGEALLKKNSHN